MRQPEMRRWALDYRRHHHSSDGGGIYWERQGPDYVSDCGYAVNWLSDRHWSVTYHIFGTAKNLYITIYDHASTVTEGMRVAEMHRIEWEKGT